MAQLTQVPGHAPDHPPAPRFIKWFVVVAVVAAFMVMRAPFVPPKQDLICTWANLKAQFNLKPRAAGVTVVCANELEPDEISAMVPELLIFLNDSSVATKSNASVGLHWHNPSDRADTVSVFALEAIKKATPAAANIEPIVTALVGHAQQIPPRNLKTGKWDHPSSIRSKELLSLLMNQYAKAGLGPQIAIALTARSDEITNDAFWRIHDPQYTYVQTLAHNIRSLTQGRSGAAKAYVAKFEAEQAAELAAPPQIKRLPELTDLNAPTLATLAGSAKPTPTSPPAPRNGTMFALLEDPGRVTSGWVTLWHENIAACSQSAPVVCVAAPTPDSTPMTWEQLKSMGIFAGAVDARIALTAPVKGTQLLSRQVASDLCAQQHGPQWRMAQDDDSISTSLSPQAWQMANYHYRKGGVISARASSRDAFKGATYWVASQDTASNCWVP